MSEIPFHSTRMGQRFYEHTMPELVRQLARLNENLERLITGNDKDGLFAPRPRDPEDERDA